MAAVLRRSEPNPTTPKTIPIRAGSNDQAVRIEVNAVSTPTTTEVIAQLSAKTFFGYFGCVGDRRTGSTGVSTIDPDVSAPGFGWFSATTGPEGGEVAAEASDSADDG